MAKSNTQRNTILMCLEATNEIIALVLSYVATKQVISFKFEHILYPTATDNI